MEEFRPPETLSLEGDIAQNWVRWKQMFQLYMTAKEADGKSDPVKIAMLLTTMGAEGLHRFIHFAWDDEEKKKKYAEVLAKFDNEFSGEKRTVFNRYKFWEYSRSQGQTFDEFYTEVKSLAAKCEFIENENMVRDKLVFDTKQPHLKEKLLSIKELTLEKTVELSRANEVAQKELKCMSQPSSSNQTGEKTISELKSRKKKKSYGSGRPNQASASSFPSGSRSNPANSASSYPSRSNQASSYSSRSNQTSVNSGRPNQAKCGRCGRSHPPRSCPAFGEQCRKCLKYNHFAKMCHPIQRTHHRMHEVTLSESDSSDEFFMDSIEVKYLGTLGKNSWFETINVNNARIKMKIDSGAETNTIPYRTWKKIKNSPAIKASGVILRALGGADIQHRGVANVVLKAGNASTTTEVFITMKKTPPILGLQACLDLGIIEPGVNARNAPVKMNIDAMSSRHTREGVITQKTLETEYEDVFTGLGTYPGEYKITLKNDARPVINTPRKVPPKLQEPLRRKLADMVDKGIIRAVDEPTEWVNHLVITEKKDGSLRLCLDPKDLNENIRREHFQLPTFDDIACHLHGKKVFTILDQKDSFWQVKLEKDSSKLCTFHTPFGRYMFLRMPFGISSASEVQQKKAFQVFGDLKGIFMVADDMLIAAENEEEHDSILRKVLERARTHNIKFNLKKT